MRKIFIVFTICIITSCNFKKKESITVKPFVIPSIEKNISDVRFELINGVLLFNKTPYSGILNEYYKGVKLKSKSQYFEGKREGYYKGWYVNGNKWFERTYKKGIKIGTHLGWYINKRKMFEYHFNMKGAYHGTVKEWYKNKQLLKVFNYVEGKEDGSQKMWKENGKIKANFVVKNGERFGLIGLKKCYSVNTVDENFN